MIESMIQIHIINFDLSGMTEPILIQIAMRNASQAKTILSICVANKILLNAF